MNQIKLAYENWKEGVDCFGFGELCITVVARQPFLRIDCEKGNKETFQQLNELKDEILREVNPFLSAIQYRFPIKDDDRTFDASGSEEGWSEEGWTYVASDSFGTYHNYYYGRLILNVNIVGSDGTNTSYKLDIDELKGMQTTFGDIKKRYQVEGVIYASYGILNFEDFEERRPIDDMNATLCDYHFLEGLKIDIYVPDKEWGKYQIEWFVKYKTMNLKHWRWIAMNPLESDWLYVGDWTPQAGNGYFDRQHNLESDVYFYWPKTV
jgi:hypothetical protein